MGFLGRLESPCARLSLHHFLFWFVLALICLCCDLVEVGVCYQLAITACMEFVHDVAHQIICEAQAAQKAMEFGN